MKAILTTAALAAALVLPAIAAAEPTETDKRAAVAQCKAERGKTKDTREAFKAKYHSFSRCVKQNAAEEKAENEAAQKNAAKECKAERAADPATFNEKYGTNANRKNAFGKCVSAKAKEHKDELDDADEEEAKEFRDAAKECAAERDELGTDVFAAKYGTNRNKRNAFGKCVSAKTQDS